MKSYRIVLADDHSLFRDGIKSLLLAAEGVEVIGEAGDGLELMALLKKGRPDLVILDIAMPGMGGIEAAREIKREHPGVAILFLSMHKRREYVSAAIAGGARGYLLKEDSGQELLQAVETIRSGRTFLSARLAAEFPTDLISVFRGDAPIRSDPLTHRERQVLKLIAEGKTNRQIAALLFISERTVHRHRSNIKSKLKLKRTADLVRYAVGEGFTCDPA